MHRSLVRMTAAVIAVTFALSACGGGDDGGDDDGRDGDAATTAGAGDGAGDGASEAVALARAVNLTLDDLGDGWGEEPTAEGGASVQVQACFGDLEAADLTAGGAGTPTYAAMEGGARWVVTMHTTVFDSEASAESVLEVAGSDDFASCLTDAVVAGLFADESAALAPQVDEPPLTDQSLGVVGDIVVGGTEPGFVDVHFFRTAEVVTFISAVEVGEPDGATFEDTLADLYSLIAERQADNVG